MNVRSVAGPVRRYTVLYNGGALELRELDYAIAVVLEYRRRGREGVRLYDERTKQFLDV